MVLGAAVVFAPMLAVAQTGKYTAPELIQGLGARSVGQGEAGVADSTLSTEAMWWNPSGLARMRKGELAVHFWQNFIANNLMVAYAAPSKKLGTFGASADVIDYGTTGVTGTNDPGVIGVNTNRKYILTASYASPVGQRLSFGLSVKNVRVRLICSDCDQSVTNVVSNTTALDFGTQYVLPVSLPLTLGASVRNFGPRLRSKDAEQADPLPPVVQLGAHTTLPIKALKENNTSLSVLSDVLISPIYQSPSVRVGANLVYRELYSLRVGYKYLSKADGTEGGLTAGLGLKYNSLEVDLARRFDSSSGIGEAGAPTFVALRFKF